MALITNYMSELTELLSTRKDLSSMTGVKEGEVLKPKVFEAGLRLSLGNSYFNYRETHNRGKSIFAAQAGFFTSFRLSRLWYLMPEVLYETKGSQYPEGNIRTHSLTLPLSLAISGPDDGYVRVWFQAGAYYSYRFDGKYGDNDVNIDYDFLRHEYGLCWGIGMEAMNMMQMGLYFQHRLSDLSKEYFMPEREIVHQNIYFVLGWLF